MIILTSINLRFLIYVLQSGVELLMGSEDLFIIMFNLIEASEFTSFL